MSIALVVLGCLVILVGLADIFLTVLHYESSSLFTAGAYRTIWRALHRLTRPLPARRESAVMSAGGPVMVVATIVLWLLVQIAGFALIYIPGMTNGGLDRPGHGHAVAVAILFSAATVTSLSYGDVSPHSLTYHAATALETLIGLAILTLALSYVLSLYGLLQQHGERATRLQHRTPQPADPRSLLASHFPEGQPIGISDLLRDLHEMMTAQSEAIRRYPVLYYFNTRRPYRSLPYLFWFVGAIAGTLRWGLPPEHPAARDPWLPGLLRGYEAVLDEVGARFVTTSPEESPAEEPDLAAFTAARAAGDGEGLVADYLEMERYIADLARLPRRDDEASYRGYCEWSRFVARGRAFVVAASDDLAMPTQQLYESPGDALF